MSSVPSEVLEDVLQPLNRWTLDDAQFTNRRFLRLIMERMSDVCLRKIDYAHFSAPDETGNTCGRSYISIGGPPKRRISSTHKDTATLFSEFVQALRSSYVETLSIHQLVLTPALTTVVLETPIAVRHLSFFWDSFADLSPTQFQEVVLRFSPNNFFVDSCRLRGCQISDNFIRALTRNGVLETSIEFVKGRDFDVTDDALVDFCMQPDAPVGQEGHEPEGKLRLNGGRFTKDLFRRLVEASAVSTRTQPLRMVVCPLRFEDEDLRDFAQHLSYRDRGTPRQLRIYDFPGEPRRSADTIHLRIVLSQEHRLEMMRAKLCAFPVLQHITI